ELSIRADPWFITDEDFPVVSPYIGPQKPPTQEQYERGLQWTCVGRYRQISCWPRGSAVRSQKSRATTIKPVLTPHHCDEERNASSQKVRSLLLLKQY